MARSLQGYWCAFQVLIALSALTLALPAAPAAPVQEVRHHPAQPRSNQPVTLTARLARDSEFRTVTAQFQVVEPGRYLRRTDPSFEQGWREMELRDDGQSGDATASDGLFTAVVPAEWQRHRHLVRYRLSLRSSAGKTILWPPRTNATPNFAWFVYDGFPAWNGSSRPGRSPLRTFPPAFLGTLPTFHLIADAADVARSQWDGSANRQRFRGTLISDGVVYDHIEFNNRGQGSTYVGGKNKWAFHFDPTRPFQATDPWGRPYRFPWSDLSLNACASPWVPVNRGMAGLDEALSYRAYQLAGVPAPDTKWIHFRVIDSAAESNPGSQYESDLWGLYLILQDKDRQWLRERDLPDGNLFSAESGLKYAAPGMPSDSSDWGAFTTASAGRQSESWWREHLDLPAYYSFHALNRVLGNVDLRPDGNHYLHHARGGRWTVLPHDLDMMFIPKKHWPGIVNQSRCLRHPALRLEFQARAREILDLFCADARPDGGQIGQLLAELSARLQPPGHKVTWPQLDEAMWNWHPRNNARGSFYANPCDDWKQGGGWTRRLASADFDGFLAYIRDYCTDSRPEKNYRPNDGDQRGYGFGHLEWESRDEAVPARPQIRYTGPAGFPPDRLEFTVSSFRSPSTNHFAGVQWRVGRIAAPGLAGYVAGQPWRYELEPHWVGPRHTNETATFQIPPGVCQPGNAYRVRARHQDTTGRWSRWSEPVPLTLPTGRP